MWLRNDATQRRCQRWRRRRLRLLTIKSHAAFLVSICLCFNNNWKRGPKRRRVRQRQFAHTLFTLYFTLLYFTFTLYALHASSACFCAIYRCVCFCVCPFAFVFCVLLLPCVFCVCLHSKATWRRRRRWHRRRQRCCCCSGREHAAAGELAWLRERNWESEDWESKAKAKAGGHRCLLRSFRFVSFSFCCCGSSTRRRVRRSVALVSGSRLLSLLTLQQQQCRRCSAATEGSIIRRRHLCRCHCCCC